MMNQFHWEKLNEQVKLIGVEPARILGLRLEEAIEIILETAINRIDHLESEVLRLQKERTNETP